MGELVGRVRSLFRYPVKSMAGVPLDRASVGWHGIEGDRRFAFRRVAEQGGMPWLTASRLPALILYHPRGGEIPTHVRTPDGRELAMDGVELRAEITDAFGSDVELLHLRHGIFDETPISIVTTTTLDTIARETGRAMDVRRFRPNVFVETEGDRGLPEDAWVGKILRFGTDADAPAVAVTQRDKRCVMLNLDPDTAVGDASIMKTAVRLNDNYLGVYGVVVRTGMLAAGAGVYLERG